MKVQAKKGSAKQIIIKNWLYVLEKRREGWTWKTIAPYFSKRFSKKVSESLLRKVSKEIKERHGKPVIQSVE
ncbi:MAG: hypothetical protein HQK84_12810 [Nitrospinae bacterium]|nr:hypothetical protein [Nitrospinota bacterium]